MTSIYTASRWWLTPREYTVEHCTPDSPKYKFADVQRYDKNIYLIEVTQSFLRMKCNGVPILYLSFEHQTKLGFTSCPSKFMQTVTKVQFADQDDLLAYATPKKG